MNLSIAQQPVRTPSATSVRLAVPLRDPLPLDQCGGKAFHLTQMMRQLLPVPPGFVIADEAFQRFLQENELLEFIADKLARLDVRDTTRLHEASYGIRDRVLSAEIPADIWEEVVALRHDLLDGVTVIVRSSGVGEDSQQAAFAGQLDSIGNVASDSQLREAVLACWSSYWSPRSLFYQRSRGVTLHGMGVIVQQHVTALISGVLFTQHPDAKGGDDLLLGEYCYGPGELLVAGEVNPGRFTVTRSDLVCHRLVEPEQDTALTDDVLFRRVGELAAGALLLEQTWGQPQDVEWTIDQRGELHFVQSRAITARATASGDVERPSLPDREPDGSPRDYWSNANVNENFPAPICPLLHSIARQGYYHYFRNLALAMGIRPDRVEAMEFPLRNVIGVHGARMYYNLSHIHACLQLAPFGDLLTTWFDNFVGADSDRSGSPVEKAVRPTTASANVDHEFLPRNSSGSRFMGGWWLSMRSPNWGFASSAASHPANKMHHGFAASARWRSLGEVLRIGVRMASNFHRLPQRVASFERDIDQFAEQTRPELLAQKSLRQLRADLREFLEIRCHRWLNASLADSAALLSYGLLKRLVQPASTCGEHSLHNSLLKGLRDIVSSGPILELWELSRRIRARDDWHCRVVSVPAEELWQSLQSADDDLDELRQLIDAYLDKWGFRCSGELMLTVASPQERPEQMLEILRAYVMSDGESPQDRLHRQEQERAIITARVLRQLRRDAGRSWPHRMLRSRLALLALRWAQASIALRERARLKQALLYSRCRRIVLAIGDRLARQKTLRSADDIFQLTIGEIDEHLSGGNMFPEQLAELAWQRRRWHEQLGKQSPPDSFWLAQGEYLSPSIDDAPSGVDGPTVAGDQFKGMGACGGQVTGRAAILSDIAECGKLRAGDILVTRQTDPGWAPVFFLIQGLVMERGGMLSHGAILAREYGIPTVVGVAQATQRLAHGETIRVDGDQGIVQRTDP